MPPKEPGPRSIAAPGRAPIFLRHEDLSFRGGRGRVSARGFRRGRPRARPRRPDPRHAPSGVKIPALKRTSGGTVRTLTYLVPSAGTSGLRFSSLGVWDRADFTTGIITQMAAISFGSRTLGSDVPTVGTAMYSGFVL